MTDWQDPQRVDEWPAEQWPIALDLFTTLSYRSHNLSRYLHDITCGVSRVLNSDWSIVTLHEGSRGQVIASNLDIPGAETGFSVHASVSEVVVQSGQPFLIEDVQQYPEEVNRIAGYVCYLGVPLRILSGEVIGTICSFSVQPRHYDIETIRTIECFAERAATTIDNYRLYQQQRRFNDRLEAEVNKRTIELRTAQTKLIECERLAAIGEFAAMIVHEIRNPLTTVQMGLNYFAKLDLPQLAQVRLTLAIDEANRLANLLQEILSYSKPQILQPSEINIDALIRELLVPLRAMPEAQERSIEYVPFDSAVVVLGDPDKLKQVFINLIRNACEAVALGETIRWLVTEAPIQQICISVHNGGPPIPADILPQLTQPFYSTKAEGTGLGLAIVKRIVEAHSGKLLIESSEGKGTIFSVRLPLSQAIHSPSFALEEGRND
jgi:signal transduction histidine kinase